MTQSPRHDLDEVIDRVAAKMVAGDADAEVLHRVLAQLPECAATPWFHALPVQLAAAAAIVVVAFLSARPLREETSMATLPAAEPAGATEPRSIEASPRVVAAPIRGPRLRQGYGGQARMSAGTVERPDHERSLAPVDAIDAIEMGGIAPSAMELDAAPVLEPLVLTDLSFEIKGDF